LRGFGGKGILPH